MTARRGSYGLDAPRLIPVLGVLFLANLVSGIAGRTIWPLAGASAILTCLGFGLFASRRGKFLVWDELLEGLRLQGNERVLDLGCGRGAVLLLAAERIPNGMAVGIDLWRRGDQSGNSTDA